MSFQQRVKQAGLRFTFIYLVVFLFPFPFDFLPFTTFLGEWYEDGLFWIVQRVANHLLHLNSGATSFSPSSGDSLYNYVSLLCFLSVAGLGTVIWSVFDRTSARDERLEQWLRVYVRYALASSMILYGAAKVIKSQFPYPSLDRMLQPYGDSSPMGLLWTFMGYSPGYNLFTGGAEMVGGFLLIAQCTTLLGGLICIAVMSNVVMLNFCYDVPVKIYSVHLLLMACLLALPDVKKLLACFIFNQSWEAASFKPFFTNPTLNRGALVVRTVFVLVVTGTALFEASQVKKFYLPATESPLYGIWNVEEFEMDGTVRPPLLTDGSRWRRVVVEYQKALSIQLVNDQRRRFILNLEEGQKTFELARREDPAWEASFSFTQPESGVITLDGKFDSHHIKARLRRVEKTEFLLTTRGFHWINESSFNR